MLARVVQGLVAADASKNLANFVYLLIPLGPAWCAPRLTGQVAGCAKH